MLQNSLEPAGPQASGIESLWWIAFWIAAVIYVLVIAALAFAALHRSRKRSSVLPMDAPQERSATRWVAIATGATVVVLFAFLIIDLVTSRELGAMQREQALQVRITGAQWWWRIEYQDTTPSRSLQTANELHIPVGRTVEIELGTDDVIHSFWVPTLGGKRDLIPGQKNRVWIRADSAFAAIVPAELGTPPAFSVLDELSGDHFQWRIGRNYVRLTPGERQAHLLRVEH